MNVAIDTIALDAVIATIFVSLTNARNRGDPWKALAEEFLGPAEAILKRINVTRLDLLRQHAGPASELTEWNQKVLALIETFADAIWERRGQTSQDPLLSILAPGTPNFFFEWKIGEATDRIEVLLDVLMADMCAGAEMNESQAAADNMRNILPEYRALCEKVRANRAKLEVLEKVAETVARTAHVQHSRLRRRMRADGFDPFEVRKVFPDIPGASISGTLG